MKINQDTFYKSQGFWWTIEAPLPSIMEDINVLNIDGPYCLNCYSDLVFPQEVKNIRTPKSGATWIGTLSCGYCGREFTTTEPMDAMKQKVVAQYVAYRRAEKPKVSLDDPPAQVKVRDEDDTYFLAAKLAEKDGKRVGVVYFGEKTKDQRKKDYSQIFLDLDDEQVRFDKSNKHPHDILASLTVEFPHGINEMKFKGKTTPAKK
jgi:hypothetical protein